MPRVFNVCDGLMSCSKNSVRNSLASLCRSRRSSSCCARLPASSPKTLSSSDIRVSSVSFPVMPGLVPGMTIMSQNKTHRAEQTQLLRIENSAPLGDLEVAALALEPVAVLADEDAVEIVVAVAVDDEIRRRGDHVTVDAGDAHIANHARSE